MEKENNIHNIMSAKERTKCMKENHFVNNELHVKISSTITFSGNSMSGTSLY